ncbi:MAG: YqgE/AlgH family protein [Xanthomonadales bacterium]|nr:YqgE/AlgH family protein [Xanthomonadales bacterium]MCE7931759.1 YqgE/AlgH family protein [Xanthomonadales bacterium PRO6]
MLKPTYLANHLLIAMPGLADPNFSRGVTFLCQHSAEGALGIVVNRLSNFRLGEVLEQMQISTSVRGLAEQPVYAGGPVQTDRGFVVHAPGDAWDSTFKVSDEVAVTTSRDVLAAMAQGRGPQRALVALGYAGWGAGQLEDEIRGNAWLSVPAQGSILFETPLETRWQAAAMLAGVDMRLLIDYAGHA